MSQAFIVMAIVAGLVIATVHSIPQAIRTTVEIRFDAPVQAVWQVYADIESQPHWRSDLDRVEMASDKTAWTETLKSSGMTVHFKILEQSPPHRLVLETGSGSHFEGRYVAEFRQQQGATMGVFTEEVRALGVVSKVMRRLFFSPQKFIEEFAKEAQAEIERRKSGEG